MNIEKLNKNKSKSFSKIIYDINLIENKKAKEKQNHSNQQTLGRRPQTITTTITTRTSKLFGRIRFVHTDYCDLVSTRLMCS